MLKIYHNPRCSKSRETLQLLNENDVEFEITEYLKDIPNKEELESILRKLGLNASDIVRKSEPIYKEKYVGKEYSEAEWVEILVENPKLIERPIVVKGDKAVLGRPPANVLDLL